MSPLAITVGVVFFLALGGAEATAWSPNPASAAPITIDPIKAAGLKNDIDTVRLQLLGFIHYRICYVKLHEPALGGIRGFLSLNASIGEPPLLCLCYSAQFVFSVQHIVSIQ